MLNDRKMKRKDVEDDVMDDFSNISLSAPSRKSRRLDGDLLPIMEEDPITGVPQVFEQEQNHASTSMFQIDAPVIDALPLASISEERALVLYNPKNMPFFKSPSSPEFSIIVNSDLIPGLKDHLLWLGNSKQVKTMEDEAATKSSKESNACLAVVPWIASQFPSIASGAEAPETGLSEPMEAEEAEMMDTEDNVVVSSGGKAFEFGVAGGTEGLQLWQQQQPYCMTPQFLQNTSTPVIW